MKQLVPAVEDVISIFKEGMFQDFSIFEVGIENLNMAADDFSGEYLKKNVDFVLVDPPFITRSELKLLNPEYDECKETDMGYLVQFASESLFYSAHGHILCSHRKSNYFVDLIRGEEAFWTCRRLSVL